MKYILYVLIAVFSMQAYSSASRDEYLLQRQIEAVQHQNKVYGYKAVIARENGFQTSPGASQAAKDLVRRSIAVDIPTATKVGTPTLSRIKQLIKAPGSKVIGVYAVMQLLEGIGWIMEDGTYIKKIDQEQDEEGYYHYACKSSVESNQCRPEYGTGAKSSTALGACQAVASASITVSGTSASQCRGYKTENGPNSYSYVTGYYAGKYKATSPSNETKVPLTPALLGAAMLGEGYKDPDPTFDNDKVNTGDWTGVADAYEHDPNGVGDELADAMDDKLKNAKPTYDGKSSYIGDPKYDENPLTDGDTSSDRSWDSDAGEATAETKPETDPETGEATGGQSISIKFPIFCQWASSMCQWYDDWTEFTKDETEDEEKKDEPDTSILDREFDTTFSANASCPPNPQIEFPIVGNVELPFNKICDFFAYLKIGVLAASSLIACWIISAAVRGADS